MVPSVTGKKIPHSLPEGKKRSPSAKGKGISRRFRREKSDGKGRGGSSKYPIVEVYNDGSKNQTSHMKVLPGYAVLDCGASATLRQSMRGIGNQIVSSFMKLRVPGSIDGKEVSFSPSVTPGDIPPLVGNDHLIPGVAPSICIQMSVVSKSHLVELMQSCM